MLAMMETVMYWEGTIVCDDYYVSEYLQRTSRFWCKAGIVHWLERRRHLTDVPSTLPSYSPAPLLSGRQKKHWLTIALQWPCAIKVNSEEVFPAKVCIYWPHFLQLFWLLRWDRTTAGCLVAAGSWAKKPLALAWAPEFMELSCLCSSWMNVPFVTQIDNCQSNGQHYRSTCCVPHSHKNSVNREGWRVGVGGDWLRNFILKNRSTGSLSVSAH